MIFNYCPDCGGKCNKINFKTFKCSVCSRHCYNEPSMCAAVLIKNKDNKYMFIRRNIEPNKGSLALPGGFVDNKENLEEAAAREAREECGATVKNVRYFGSYDVITELYGDALVAFFTADLVKEGFADGVEVKEYFWFSKNEIDIDQIKMKDVRLFINDFLRDGK